MYKLLIIAIAALFFPVLIQVAGSDAITTGSLGIFVLLVVYLTQRPHIFSRTYFPRVILALVIIGLISSVSIGGEWLLPSIRRYLGSAAGLFLFFMVININSRVDAEEQRTRVEFLLSFVLIMYAIQLLIGIAVYFMPQVGNYLSVFTQREKEVVTIVTGGVKRMSSIMVGREGIGEIVAVLTPILLYKILAKQDKFYYFILAVFFVGVALSATRSGFLLFFFGLLLFALTVLPMIKLPTWSLFVVGLVVGGPLSFVLFPQMFAPILERIGEFFTVYAKSDSLALAVNRAGVWYYVETALIPNISLFGNGFLSIYNGFPFDFHNLYATVLHRYGIIGFPLFFYLFYKVSAMLLRARRMCSRRADRALLYACLISILILLINEFKFDFIRGASYQQTVWLLLGIYYLAYLSISRQYYGGTQQGAAKKVNSGAKGLLGKYKFRNENTSPGH